MRLFLCFPRLRFRKAALAGTALTVLLLIWAATGAAQEVNVGFSERDLGRFPSDWKAKEKEGASAYTVRKDQNGVCLHAESEGSSYTIGHEIEVDLALTPLLEISWRPLVLPPGGDERHKETDDSSLGVYVIFEGGFTPPPRSLKYVWSTTLSPGTTTPSPFSKQSQIVVLESGPAKLNQWVTERVNVLEDYRRLFREKDTPKVKGIAVLTDSDNTGSRAAGDYLLFRFLPGPK